MNFPTLVSLLSKKTSLLWFLLHLTKPSITFQTVKSAPRLSTFEFAIFIMSVICCWLQFSLFGFVYSLITIKKNLDEIEHNFCYRE